MLGEEGVEFTWWGFDGVLFVSRDIGLGVEELGCDVSIGESSKCTSAV